MTTLVLNFDAASPPGHLSDLLAGQAHAHAWPLRDGVPPGLAGAARVILLGGDLSANDPHPALEALLAALAARDAAARPTLGICLGSQILARALGAAVVPLPQGELGVMEVALTPHGRRDPLFAGQPASLPVVQAHGEGFALPAGATLLASSADCPVQAFRRGASVGLQFHPEATADTLRGWAGSRPPAWLEDGIARRYAAAEAAGRAVLRAWLSAA